MRFLPLYSLLLATASSSALASDRVEFGPAPSWVLREEIPKPGVIKDGPAVLPLVSRQQVRLEPGKTSVHSEMALKFLTPEGLAAGILNLQWRPDKDEVRVHRISLLRDGKEIDLLASGTKFELLRRETNLEQATLDGQLTAVMQPEGLQVGDTLVVSMTVTSSDPVMGRHAEFGGGIANGASAKSILLRVEWPSNLALSHRFYEMPNAQFAKNGAWQSAEWRMSDPPLIVPPKGAPGRFYLGRRIEFSDFENWTALSDLFRPIYDQASVIPASGPLRAEADKIRRASTDLRARASAALALVEDKVRYVNLAMGQGNYVPADATATWERRFGDCKAKTALLVALLRDLGVRADPVLVSTTSGDGLDQRLPMITQFDHVIVRAVIDGKDYWLDGTRGGDAGIDQLTTPAFGWGLPLVQAAKLVRLQPAPLTVPSTETIIALDASGGPDRPAPTTLDRIFRGDAAIFFNAVMASVPANARDNAFREIWKEAFSDFTVTRASGVFEREKAEYRLHAEGNMKLDLQAGRYEIDVPTLGYIPDFKRETGASADAPWMINFPEYTRWVQTIVTSDRAGLQPMLGAAPIDQTLAGRRYRRTIGKKDGVIRIETNSQSLVPEVSYAEALSAEAALKKLKDQSYYIALSDPTEEDTRAELEKEPTDVWDFLARGNALVRIERYEEAVAAFDKAVSMDPKSPEAFESRGLTKIKMNDLAGARLDFETARQLGSTTPYVDMVTVSEAAQKGDMDEAIRLISALIAKHPENPLFLMNRAGLLMGKGNLDGALADTLQVTRLLPDDAQARLMRVNIFRGQQKHSAAIAEADQLLKLKLPDAFGYVAAARTFSAYGLKTQMNRAFELALALKPQAYIYLNRAVSRPKEDKAGRRLDVNKAFELDPNDSAVLGAMAELLVEEKDYQGAIVKYDTAVKKYPSDLDLRVKRGITYVRLGQTLRADSDFAFARAESEKNPTALNSLCWTKATAGLALESALADCDLALKLTPKNPGYLDSRGLVLLRLGRIDEAITAYSQAIELSQGKMASALFGRALAWNRKGDSKREALDAKAATLASNRIQSVYKDMGLELKTP